MFPQRIPKDLSGMNYLCKCVYALNDKIAPQQQHLGCYPYQGPAQSKDNGKLCTVHLTGLPVGKKCQDCIGRKTKIPRVVLF